MKKKRVMKKKSAWELKAEQAARLRETQQYRDQYAELEAIYFEEKLRASSGQSQQEYYTESWGDPPRWERYDNSNQVTITIPPPKPPDPEPEPEPEPGVTLEELFAEDDENEGTE